LADEDNTTIEAGHRQATVPKKEIAFLQTAKLLKRG